MFSDNDVAKVDGFYSFFSFSTTKRGYSGVATYVSKRLCPYKVEFGADVDIESEGMVEICLILNDHEFMRFIMFWFVAFVLFIYSFPCLFNPRLNRQKEDRNRS